MASAPKAVFSVSVRDLVEFALRSGDLGGERDFVGPHRALAGIRGHQRVQRSRPEGYQKEVPLAYDTETEEFIVRVQGRIDGLLASDGGVLIEEIKTVQGSWDKVADPLHWAQAKVYGFIYTRQHALDGVALRLTYLNLDTGELTEFEESCSAEELKRFFEATTAIFIQWTREYHAWCRQRNESLQALEFPFGYRPGQRDMAIAAYRAMARGGRVFVEAPTGIGKTISAVFPAVKAIGEGKLERVFYLTARTVGRVIAEKTFADLREAGARVRTLTLTAKEKICIQASQPCDPATCPLAKGYYDRRRPAMRAALKRETLTRPVVEEIAQQHQVCPFELSLDLSSWVEAVICDYNYVFDPKAYLRRHFGEEQGDYAFLVDEAHNLVERGREMFSAELTSGEIQAARRAMKGKLPACAKALNKVSAALRELAGEEAETCRSDSNEPEQELELFEQRTGAQAGRAQVNDADTQRAPLGLDAPAPRIYRHHVPNGAERENRGVLVRRDFPGELIPLLEEALRRAETWLARNEPAEFREQLLELYFRLFAFLRTAEHYDERYATLLEPGPSVRIRLLCLDPSHLLREALERGKAAVFFSATLTPIEYYRELLGGSPEDVLLQLPSPFPPENLAVLVQDRIGTHLKARADSLAAVAEAVRTTLEQRRGNYLVYLPSYQYLRALHEAFQSAAPGVKTLAQRPGMSEPEREQFLGAFSAEHEETLVGFAVLGGVFGEGIDLVGERLIGAIIVGVGLPQLCAERDLMAQFFQEQRGSGFDYAYTFPGMNRVLQATGRVIRSETDRGVVLLIDTRFGQRRYQALFPRWWRARRAGSVEAIRKAVAGFWGERAENVERESVSLPQSSV